METPAADADISAASRAGAEQASAAGAPASQGGAPGSDAAAEAHEPTGTDHGGSGAHDEPGAPPEPLGLVIVCPNCNSSFPYVTELEGFVPKRSSRYKTCEECEGMGMVSTGSFISANSSIQCHVCNGAGFVDSQTGAPPPLPPDKTPPWQGAQWNPETQSWY